MSFTPGWYDIEYSVGAGTKQVTGFVAAITDMGGAFFLRLESPKDTGERVRHIQVHLIQTLEETTPPSEQTGHEPPTVHPAPDAVKVVAEETEEQTVERFHRVCKWCHHSLAWHPVAGGAMETCGMLDCRCPFMRDDPVFAEGGLAMAELPAADFLEPERVESSFPPATTPLPLAVRVDWLCGMCGHSTMGHDAEGDCLEIVFTAAEEPEGYRGNECGCKVAPDAPKAFFALDAPARWAGIQAAARAAVGEQSTPTTEQDTSGWDDYTAFLDDTLTEAGIDKAAFVKWWQEKVPPPTDTLATFARSLDEVRADLVGEPTTTTLRYGVCKSCEDPWMWHGGAEGVRCRGAQCECLHLVTETECFVAEEGA